MKKTEYFLLGTFIIGIILKLLNINSNVLILSSLFISLFYCFFSFACFNQIELKKIFKKSSYINSTKGKIILSIISGFFLSIITFGIESKLLSFEIGVFGPDYFLLTGLKTCGLILLTSIILWLKQRSAFYKNLMIRMTIIELIGLIIYFTI